MKCILIILTFILATDLKTQPLFYSHSNHKEFAEAVVASLPASDFFFISQIHNNSANTILEQDLIIELNKRRAVRYYILEHPHSSAVLLNEFLDTGNDSILEAMHNAAAFKMVRAIKKYNDSINPLQRIRFYGIDFEGYKRGMYLRPALTTILNTLKDQKSELSRLISHTIDATEEKDQEERVKNILAYLMQNEAESRSALQTHFLDLLLIGSSRFGFHPNRDDEMYTNFLMLYKELQLTNELPLRFFSSFGYAHLGPKNKKGIGFRMQNTPSSPVKDKVSILGVQYFNSQSTNIEMGKRNGHLSILCKKENNLARALGITDKNSGFLFLENRHLQELSCDKAVLNFQGVIVVNKFAGSWFWSWE